MTTDSYILFSSGINIVLFIIIFTIGIYSFVLFVKLAKRGIKALDIYIKEKENEKL